MSALEDPQVSVDHPIVDGVPMRDLLVASCSEHGDVTDWLDRDQRNLACLRAREHANSEHDGLVDAVGWVR